MKKIFIIALLAVVASIAVAAFTTSADSPRTTFQNGYAWSGHEPKDKALDWAQEAEDKIDTLEAQAAGTTASLMLYTVEIADANDTLTAAESGKVFVTDFTGTITLTLPDAAAGLTYTFIDNSAVAGDDVVIAIQSGDNIEGDTNGDGYTCAVDAEGSSITFVAINDTRWIVLSTTGTWAAL